MRHTLIVLAAWAALSLELGGCGTAPAKPVAVKARIAAVPEVNPNSQGRPSPVHVRVFQLKEDGAFIGADFFTLIDKEQETLGSSLVQRLEYDLTPGESREIEIKIVPEAHVLAVMAEFADYRNAQWRAVAQTPHKTLMDMFKKDRITIQIEKNKAVINVGD